MLTLADYMFSIQLVFVVVAKQLSEMQLASWRREMYVKCFGMNRLDSRCPVQLSAEGKVANRVAIWAQLTHTVLLWLPL